MCLLLSTNTTCKLVSTFVSQLQFIAHAVNLWWGKNGNLSQQTPLHWALSVSNYTRTYVATSWWPQRQDQTQATPTLLSVTLPLSWKNTKRCYSGNADSNLINSQVKRLPILIRTSLKHIPWPLRALSDDTETAEDNNLYLWIHDKEQVTMSYIESLPALWGSSLWGLQCTYT